MNVNKSGSGRLSGLAVAQGLIWGLLGTAAFAAPVSLFDGKTLNGWEGSPKLWSVKNGVIGVQVHGGGKALIEIKDVSIEVLPDTPGALTWEKVVPSK